LEAKTDKARKPKRTFLLLDVENSPTELIFRSATPRGAALKAAHRGHEDIVLFDGKSKWVQRYRGWSENIGGRICMPKWLWETGYKPRRYEIEYLGREKADKDTAAQFTQHLLSLAAPG
jgi:hypothetical protein